MEPKDRLQFVGILRQALKPLLEEAIIEKAIADVNNRLEPILEKIEARLEETPQITITGLEQVGDSLQSLAKRDSAQTLELPDIQKLTVELANVSSKLAVTKSIGDYRPHDQEDNTLGTEYAGFVAPTGEWYIVRAQDGEQRYAAGSGDYETAWLKKSKISYDYLNKVMS